MTGQAVDAARERKNGIKTFLESVDGEKRGIHRTVWSLSDCTSAKSAQQPVAPETQSQVRTMVCGQEKRIGKEEMSRKGSQMKR